MNPEWQIRATRNGCEWLNDHAGGWQFGESGFLKAICERLKVEDGVEIGAGDGESLPLTLGFIDDTKLTLYEADDHRRAMLKSRFPDAFVYGKFQRLQTLPIGGHICVVVDVDSNDLQLAQRIAKRNSPAVLCVEHADLCGPGAFAALPPPDWLLGMQLADGGFIIQASATAIETTLKPLGYVLVGISRVNSIFVRSDLVATLEGC